MKNKNEELQDLRQVVSQMWKMVSRMDIREFELSFREYCELRDSIEGTIQSWNSEEKNKEEK